MERVRSEILQSIDSHRLHRLDLKVRMLIATIGAVLFAVSIVGTWIMPGALPGLWSELGLVIAVGLVYELAVRRAAVDLRLGSVYTGLGILTSLPLLILGALCSLYVYNFMEPIGVPEFWSFLVFGGSFFGSVYLAEAVGKTGAKRVWRATQADTSIGEKDAIYRNAFYLVKHNWTNSWFYAWAFLLVEFTPVMIRYLPASLWYVALIVGGMAILLFRAWYILDREQRVAMARRADDRFIRESLQQIEKEEG
jgi:hypothetical protein